MFLRSELREVRKCAAAALGRLGNCKRSAGSLAAALKDAEPAVRVEALNALGRLEAGPRAGRRGELRRWERWGGSGRVMGVPKATKQDFRVARTIPRTIPSNHTPNHTCNSYPLYQLPGAGTPNKYIPVYIYIYTRCVSPPQGKQPAVSGTYASLQTTD